MAINFPTGVGPGTLYTDPTSGNNYVYEGVDPDAYWRFLPEFSAQGAQGVSGGVQGRGGRQGTQGLDTDQGTQGFQGF